MLDDYLDTLREKVAGYEGEYVELMTAAPDLLQLMDSLLKYDGLSEEQRLHVKVAVDYFVSPVDVMSEQIYGYMGYIDDLFLASYTLKKVLEDVPLSVLEGMWKGDGDLVSVVDEVYRVSSGLLGSKVDEVLERAGFK